MREVSGRRAGRDNRAVLTGSVGPRRNLVVPADVPVRRVGVVVAADPCLSILLLNL